MVKVKAKCPRCKNAFEHEVDLSEVIEREATKKAKNLAPSSKMSSELKKKYKEEAKNEVKLDHANELQLEKQKRTGGIGSESSHQSEPVSCRTESGPVADDYKH